MNGIKLISILIAAFLFKNIANAQTEQDTVINVRIVSAPDTIYRTDTIVIKEVITRTDVVHRTEKVVRYEEKFTGGTESHLPFSDKTTVDVLAIDPLNAENKGEESFSESAKGNRIYFKYPDGTIVSSEANNISGLRETKGEGNFIWVPDTLDKAVMDVLQGRYPDQTFALSKKEEEYDPNEKVIFRGDTIPMFLKDRNLGRYDRGLFNYLYTPKGIWQLGLTASYGEFSTADLQILDLVSDIDFSGKIFSVRPYFSYFLKNNMSLGLRLGYTDGKASIGSFNVDIDEDMSFHLHDIMYRSQTYSASVTLTNYFGITRKGRFGFFNEVEFALAGGSSDFHRPYNGELRKTHTNIFEAGLNFSPGISVYILEQLSFNVSFGVFGLNIKNEKQKVNDEPWGERTTSGANFRFNIFNINFGIAVNI